MEGRLGVRTREKSFLLFHLYIRLRYYLYWFCWTETSENQRYFAKEHDGVLICSALGCVWDSHYCPPPTPLILPRVGQRTECRWCHRFCNFIPLPFQTFIFASPGHQEEHVLTQSFWSLARFIFSIISGQIRQREIAFGVECRKLKSYLA